MNAIMELGLLRDVPDSRLAPGAAPITWVWYLNLKFADEIARVYAVHPQSRRCGCLSTYPICRKFCCSRRPRRVWPPHNIFVELILYRLKLLSNEPVAQAGTPIDAIAALFAKELRYAVAVPQN
jgi:hypothetical protein